MSETGKILFLDRTLPESPAEKEPAAPPDKNAALADLVRILIENGMDPVLQLSGYLVSEDPTYLPEGTDARSIAHKIGRDGLLSALISSYMESLPASEKDE